MEKCSFLKNLNIKQKIVLIILLVSMLISCISMIVGLRNINNSLITENENKTKNIVQIAVEIIDFYYNQAQSGEITVQEAQREALNKISLMKYDGKNYVWVTRYDDKMLSHPTLAGKSITDVADINGIRFFHDGVVLAKEKDSGFIKYHWTKQGESPSNIYPKVSYFQNYPKWNWVVASGCYLDSVQNIVKSTFLQIFVYSLLTVIFVIVVGILTIVKDIVNSMKKITLNLKETSADVKSASAQLNSASEKLAEGSTEQASSMQETSSTLEETSSMVQQNNENTKQANVLAKKTQELATQSNKKMTEMTNAMDELKKASSEIEKIIKVIDDIAFQTNILSLNAAVEAARAGDVGRGFAVVAEEVRSLAQRSAEAAKDTTDIISKNITLSESGSNIAKAVQQSIIEINDQNKKLNDLLDEVSVATNEQTQGIGQINKAVSQMETVINSNAQTAEESSAAAKALFDQTLSLNEIIDNLEKIVIGAKASSSFAVTAKNETRVTVSKPTEKTLNKPKLTVKQQAKPQDIIPLGESMDNF